MPRRRPRSPLTALTIGVVVALLLVEGVARILPAPAPAPQALYFKDSQGRRTSPAQARARGIVVPIAAALDPRPEQPRHTFAPGVHFFICFEGERQPWHDGDGCVEVRFSSYGIREREEIGFEKPPGQRRLLCLGDSFTFGWGIRAEDGWVRLLEKALREKNDNLRTVNCGAAGTTVVDEYQYGLEKRFHRFQPDAVLVSLFPNDLVISNSGLGVLAPPPATLSALLNRVLLATRNPLNHDSDLDVGAYLLGLPRTDPLYVSGPMSTEVSYDMLWASGGPQQSLVAMLDWCRERELPFAVVLWPYLQGLEEGDRYPLETVHGLVAAFCAERDIPFLDLLPTLRGQVPASLWVHPADMHANPRAQALVVPDLLRFTLQVTGW